MPNPGAARVDERHFLKDALLRAIAQPRRAANPLLDRSFDVGAGYDVAAGLTGPKIGLGKHVIELVDDKRQLVGMIGQPGRVLDHQRGAGAIDRLKAMPPRQRRDHARVRGFRRRRPIDIILEIGEHLEMLGDIRVEGRQQVVQQPIAEQDHLHIERDRIGFERDGACQPDEIDPGLRS